MTNRSMRARRAVAVLMARVAVRRGVVVDVETTDLFGRVVQVGVCDLTGRVLLDELVCAPVSIRAEAHQVHGISDADCASAPEFAQLHPRLRALLRGRLVVAYNAPYDRDVLDRECREAGLAPVAGRWWWLCAMRARQAVEGGPFQRLDGSHQAAGDAVAAAVVVRDVASQHVWARS